MTRNHRSGNKKFNRHVPNLRILGGTPPGGEGEKTDETQKYDKVTCMWIRLDKALLLKLIREHEVATSESRESGASRHAAIA